MSSADVPTHCRCRMEVVHVDGLLRFQSGTLHTKRECRKKPARSVDLFHHLFPLCLFFVYFLSSSFSSSSSYSRPPASTCVCVKVYSKFTRTSRPPAKSVSLRRDFSTMLYILSTISPIVLWRHITKRPQAQLYIAYIYATYNFETRYTAAAAEYKQHSAFIIYIYKREGDNVAPLSIYRKGLCCLLLWL